jgi:excisionase family DNA binding protein
MGVMVTMASHMKLLSPQEAAKRLGLSLSRIHQFCRKGRLGQPVGGVYVIPEDELRQFAKKPRNPGRPPEKRQS